jgi:hypothetical protein
LVGGPPGVELHTVVDELPSGDTGDMVPVVLPSGDTGDMVPVVLPPNAVGMVPNAVAGMIAVDNVVVDDVIVAALPATDVETVLGTVDSGAGAAVMEGGAGVGTAGVGGTGTVEPGIVDMNEVAGCADSASTGAVVLPAVDVEEGIVGVANVDGVVPVVPPIADMEVTGTA